VSCRTFSAGITLEIKRCFHPDPYITTNAYAPVHLPEHSPEASPPRSPVCRCCLSSRWHGHPARVNLWPRWPCHFNQRHYRSFYPLDSGVRIGYGCKLSPGGALRPADEKSDAMPPSTSARTHESNQGFLNFSTLRQQNSTNEPGMSMKTNDEGKKSRSHALPCGTAILAVTAHGQDARATLEPNPQLLDCKIERTNRECL